MTRKTIDWEAVEIQYRAGIRSLKSIGGEYGVSDAAIIKRAKRDAWSRDLTGKIQAKADAKVSAALVSAEVSAQTKITEKLTVEVEATNQARVRIAQRTDITRMRRLVIRLLDECEIEADDITPFQELGVILRSEDRNGNDKLNDAYNKAISLPARIKGVKDLADALKVLVSMEREAYGIDKIIDIPPPPLGAVDPIEGARRLAFVLAKANNALPAMVH